MILKPATLISGALLLAVDPASGTISGYLRADWIGNGTAAAPQFTCDIALAGAPGKQKIIAWSPGGAIAVGATKMAA